MLNDLDEIWNKILDKMTHDYGVIEVSCEIWLRPLKLLRMTEDTLIIYIPNTMVAEALNYIDKQYKALLKNAAAEVIGHIYEIELTREALPVEHSAPTAPVSSPNFEDSNLNPKYTFETFVVGSNNNFAYNACLAVAETPGSTYNPLFLYGGVGLGKTHLMHSIGNYIMQKDPSKKVLYITSEEFMNEVIEAIRKGNIDNHSMKKVREKYRNVDILLLDDVQFIIGKESTQEEFFHTFNALHGSNKQIVLTSDKHPKELETLEERLRSRFESGLSTDIGAPDFETRVAILRKKVKTDNFELDDEVIQYIAKNIKSNIRELEGALNKLIAKKRLDLSIDEIDIDLAKDILQDIIHPDQPKQITVEMIIKIVCEHFNVPQTDIYSKKRSKDISQTRFIIMYLSRQMTDKTMKEIGQILNKDHSTIIHGLKEMDKKLTTDENLRKTVETLQKKIQPN